MTWQPFPGMNFLHFGSQNEDMSKSLEVSQSPQIMTYGYIFGKVFWKDRDRNRGYGGAKHKLNMGLQ